MKFLGTLLLAVVFACSAAVPALADDSCNPGEMSGPPCLSAPATSSESTTPGETTTPPAADSADLEAIAEMALHSLLLF